jgi:hypothetical protein
MVLLVAGRVLARCWIDRSRAAAGARLELARDQLARLRASATTWRDAALHAQGLLRGSGTDRAGGDGPAFTEAYRQGLAGARCPARRPIVLAGTRWLPYPDDRERWFTWYEWLVDHHGFGAVDAARTATHRVFGVDPAVEVLGAAA